MHFKEKHVGEGTTTTTKKWTPSLQTERGILQN